MSSYLNLASGAPSQDLDRIETEQLFPIAINDNTINFVFPANKGILEKHTTLILPVVAANANTQYALSCGVTGLIRACEIKIGGRTLSRTEDLGGQTALHQNFLPQEVRRRLERPRKGIYTAMEYNFRMGVKNRPAAGGATPAAYSGGSSMGKMRLSDLTYAENAATGADNANRRFGVAGGLTTNYQLTNNNDTTARFYLRLEDMFPETMGTSALQLPLMAIDEKVEIVIYLNPQSERTIFSQGNARGNVTIIENECMMLVDYLYYTPEATAALMARTMSKEGMVMNYSDCIVNKINLQAGAQPAAGTTITQRYNLNIGMTGRRVKQMYFRFEPLTNTELFHKYCSEIGSRVALGEELQIRINNEPVFPDGRGIVEDGEKYFHLEQAKQMLVHIPMAMYSMAGGGFVDQAFVNARDTSNATANVANALVLHEFQSNVCSLGFDTVLGYAMIGDSAGNNTDSGAAKTNIGLVGKSHYLGCNLQKPIMDMTTGTLSRGNVPGSGVLIGASPILIEYSRETTRQDFAGRLMHVYSIVEKQARIINGKFVATD